MASPVFQVPGAVAALKRGALCKFRLHAFGVINHLSRHPASAAALVEAGFVGDILSSLPLDERGADLPPEQEAIVA
ncbi:hypothetical protein T484DRAFT_1790811, partial [Baffinella frigidus]